MRYKNKSQVRQKWQSRINEAKEYHKILFDSGQTKTSFYDSEVYNQLNKRRNRSLYRYDNKEKISEQRKNRRELHKKQLDYLGEENLTEFYSGSAIDAFKGRRAKGDSEFIKNIKPENFAGKLFVQDGETGEILEDKTYFSQSYYFMRVAFWVHLLFSKSDGYKIFNSEVDKSQRYDTKTKTLFWETTITINE